MWLCAIETPKKKSRSSRMANGAMYDVISVTVIIPTRLG
jgi:hypothetical protein